MPYDKGDFTQQGIDGKVSGGLLLNNKRDVDVLVSTNEDDSTLGRVAVTIEDHLNDLKYAFFGENLEAGEVYEIGAGGGIDNPILTLTIDASGVLGDQGWIDYLTITENNILKNISGISIIGGETYEFNILVPAWDNGDDPDVFVWNNTSANGGFVGTTKVITASNEINCVATVDQPNGSLYIMVTDPTQPASATLTVTNS